MLLAAVWAQPGGPSIEDKHPTGGAGPRPEADLPGVMGLCEESPLPPVRAGGLPVSTLTPAERPSEPHGPARSAPDARRSASWAPTPISKAD